ncbi:MAG TPA: ABC transporter permease [Desulfatiglandales bacterium]|nr:ABC transporter permease [Desulfatiglandales bacterium]
MFKDLFAGRELAWRLAVRDISAQYRQTALGLLWAFIMPLAHTLIWIFLSGSGIVTIRDTALPYPVYVFSGTIIWAIFMDAVNAPLHQTTANKQMLAKINFPREALIVSGIYQILFNSVIRVILMIFVLLFFKIYPGWTLILFPFGILSLILTGTTLGLLLTPVGMLYTDIGRGIPLVMQFLMYLCPVVFPIPTEGWAAVFFRLNPMTPLIMTTRDWLTGISPEFLSSFSLINLFIIVLLLVVWVIYRTAMPILIERMSA